VKTTKIVNGKTVVGKTVQKELVKGNIRTYLPEIMLALTRRQLNNTDMLMMALGTIRAETASFRPIDEGVSKYNTTPVGTPGRFPFDKYEPGTGPGIRIGNTDEGDGALFKGRGFVQLTGRDNYTNVGRQIGVNLAANPDLANDPAVAAATLAQYLKNVERKVVAALAEDDLRAARKSVNGGSHGLEEFKAAFAAGRKYLGITVLPKAKAGAKSAAKAKPKPVTTAKKK
jgi:putative chitinase